MLRTGPAAPRARSVSRVQTILPARHSSSSEVFDVRLDARGQDVLFPCARRGLKTFQLIEHGGQRVAAFAARVRRQMLPLEQEAHEVVPFDRLDLASQAFHRVAMDAREQMTLAPFFVGALAGVKRPRIT